MPTVNTKQIFFLLFLLLGLSSVAQSVPVGVSEDQPETLEISGRLERTGESGTSKVLLHSADGVFELITTNTRIPSGNEVKVQGRLAVSEQVSGVTPMLEVETMKLIRGQRDLEGVVDFLPDQQGGMWVMEHGGAFYHLAGDMKDLEPGDKVRVRGNTTAMGPS